MKNTEVIPDLKGRKYKGHIAKIKRIRTEPRQKIRQLLRSFMPLAEIRQWEKSGNSTD